MIHSSLCSLGRYRNSRCDTATHRCGFTGRQRRKKKINTNTSCGNNVISQNLLFKVWCRTDVSKTDTATVNCVFFLLLYHFQGHGRRTGGLKSIPAFIWWRPGSPRNSVLVYHRATCRDRKQIVLDGWRKPEKTKIHSGRTGKRHTER